MGNIIKIKRGFEANRPSVVPVDGELIVTLDQNKLYYGSASIAGGIAITSSYSTFSVSSSYNIYIPESASLWTSSYDVATTVPSSSKEALDTIARLWYNTDHDLQRKYSTVLISGGVLSVNGTGSINISSGSGYIVDQNPNTFDLINKAPKPMVYEIEWDDLSNVIIPDTGSIQSTYVAIDISGSVFLQSSLFSDIQRRDYIYLGKVIHRTGQISSVVNEGAIGTEIFSNFRDLTYTIGPINILGNVFNHSGSSLLINKSYGETYRLMANYETDYKSPSRLINPSQTPVTNIRYVQRNAANDNIIIYSPSASIDPTRYDAGGGVLTNVPNAGSNYDWSIQRIYYFPYSNTTYIFYGQATYTSLSAAQSGIATEEFSFVSADFLEASLFRGWLLVRGNETNLSSINTKFISAGKFGNIGSSPAAGGSITSFSDSQFFIYNATDSTKQLLFDLSQIPTGAKLSLTASNAVDGTSITFPSVDGKLLLETGSLFGTSSWSIHSVSSSNVPFNGISGLPSLVSSSAQVNNFTVPVTASIISASSIIGTTLQGNGFNVNGVNFNTLVNVPGQLSYNIPTASLTDLIYYNNSLSNINGLMDGAAVNPGFKLVSIVASSSAATTINIGTAPLDNSIVNTEVVNTSMDEIPLGKQFFSPTVQTPLYISSPSWGGNSVNVICKFEKIVGTISSSAALAINVNAYKSSTNATASNNDVILVQTTTGAKSYQLPLSYSNSQIIIKKITSDSNYVYIYPSGSQTIDGSTSLVIQNYNSSVTLIGDGGDWYIV